VKRKVLAAVTVGISLLFLTADFIYKTVNRINRLTRGRCLIYQSLPGPVFRLFENFIELFFIIAAGLFAAVIIERLFIKVKRLCPRNPLEAFVVGSLIPVCSCGAIPLIASFRERTNIRTIITFIMAAPLLSPPFILLSWSVLGPRFTLFRIGSSMILAVSAGYLLETVAGACKLTLPDTLACTRVLDKGDILLRTYYLLKMIFPWYLAAAVLGTTFQLIPLDSLVGLFGALKPFPGIPLAALLGIPVYLCNGADILLLRPFVTHFGIPLSMASTFSVTSTAVCLSSMALLVKFLGKKLTAVLLAHIFIVTNLLGFAFAGLSW
jgi:uncharacterized membrane protein YraQ (UPF0718 family)